MATQATILADLFGIKSRTPETTLTLATSVEKGLPVSALDKLAGRISPLDVRGFAYRIVPKPTLEHAQESGDLHFRALFHCDAGETGSRQSGDTRQPALHRDHHSERRLLRGLSDCRPSRLGFAQRDDLQEFRAGLV